MLEKLFMRVFDRKQWISGQLRQQVHSYGESLACNLAASGRKLPLWLFEDFSITPKEEDNLANSSNTKVAEICDALIIPQEELEAEAFTIGTCSGETRNIQPETIPLNSLAEQLSSTGLCNLAGSPGKYKSKSLPTGTGNFVFMKTGEAALSVSVSLPVTVPVNANDRKKQLSASASASATSGSIPYQSGFPMGGLSTSGKSGKARPASITPGDNEDLSAQLEASACFTIDEDADAVPNDTDTLDPRDLSPALVGTTCFRIDEHAAEDDVPPDTDTLDPQDLSAILEEESTLPSVNDPHNLLEDDDPNYQNTLRDITAVLQNTEMGAAIPDNFSEGGGLTGKKAKQSVASLNKTELGQKASGSMQSGLATAEAIREGREKIMATLSSKPSKIISDVTSSVPLVKQKQQPVAKKRKVRIPALKAAEKNKRLEEKKRNERELQKAAMKADIAFKKRQKEEREKKEKDKEKFQTQREDQTKKEPPRRARVVREEKEVQRNVISYEMSPYKDSDAEGDDGLDELEEDQTWCNKYIPSWAQKEFLEYYLHSRKYMNPEFIFSRKRSFDMSKVLKPSNQP